VASHKIVELPGQWELHADEEGRPWLVHADGRHLEPKQFAEQLDAKDVYRALKLEEDARGMSKGGEQTDWWPTIFAARVVIGDFMNRKINGDAESDEILNREVEQALLREQRERRELWN